MNKTEFEFRKDIDSIINNEESKLNDVQQEWNTMPADGHLRKYAEYDAEQAFKAFSEKVYPKTVKTRSLWMRYAGMAASVVFVCALGMATYLYNSNQAVDETFIANITPGYAHAYLTTSDGNRIELVGDGTMVDTIGIKENLIAEDDCQPVIIEVPRGGEYKVTLSDGTKVHLNSESSIEFTRHFSGDTRYVKLTGEAYFDVVQMKDCPFVVDAHGVKVKEYGTSFNVQAYDHNRVEITLERGSIGVIVPYRGESQLTPGRQAVVCGSDISICDVDVYNVLGWTEGVFRFEDKDLIEIAKILSRWYDVKIVVDDSIKDIHFTGNIERDGNMADILDAISEIAGFKYSNDNQIIRLHK